VHFDLTDEQHEIRRIARDLLADRATLEDVGRAAEAGEYDEALWRELCELGWPGIGTAEEHGGQGLGMVGVVVLAEALGYALAPVPCLGSIAAALVIEQAGSDEQRATWLPALASGEARGALAIESEPSADVVGADIIVLADAGGGARLVHRAGAVVEELETIDLTRRYGRAEGRGEQLPGDVRSGLDRAVVAVAAELLGVCQRALDMTVAYVKDRQQFGTPVGAFQAVSHTCVEMLLATEGARSAALFAAWACDAGVEGAADAASIAKAAASDAGRKVTAAAIQAHGGVGFTWEGGLHWLYKRAQLDSVLLGGSATHRTRIAESLVARARARTGAGAATLDR
jgi:alkylation response protein AidB-like acyl-CoA dehydrogenase